MEGLQLLRRRPVVHPHHYGERGGEPEVTRHGEAHPVDAQCDDEVEKGGFLWRGEDVYDDTTMLAVSVAPVGFLRHWRTVGDEVVFQDGWVEEWPEDPAENVIYTSRRFDETAPVLLAGKQVPRWVRLYPGEAARYFDRVTEQWYQELPVTPAKSASQQIEDLPEPDREPSPVSTPESST